MAAELATRKFVQARPAEQKIYETLDNDRDVWRMR